MITRPRLHGLLLGLALLSCNFLRGDSWLKIHDKGLLHYEVGDIQSAFWVDWGSEPDRGYGAALLVLVDKEVSCADVLSTFNGYDWLYGDPLFGGASGLLGYFAWYHYDDVDAGFAGLYTTGGYAYSEKGELERWFLPLLVGDGQVYYSYNLATGYAEILNDGATVTGQIRTDLIDSNFSAENCGAVERYSYYGYYGYTYDRAQGDRP